MKVLDYEATLLLDNNYMQVSYIPEKKTVFCQVKADYIPKSEFQSTFEQISETVKTKSVQRFIFDKKRLTTFDQPSMTWYHVVWKTEMMKYGLKSYRKLLPEAQFFRMSVDIGKQRIMKEHPEFDFGKFDIQYCESLEEAFE